MENIIRKVIESEYRAQRILAEVEEERRQSAASLEAEIERAREEIFLSVRQKAEAIKAEKLENARIQAEEILSAAKAQASAMQARYREHKDSWVDSLILRVMNSEP